MKRTVIRNGMAISHQKSERMREKMIQTLYRHTDDELRFQVEMLPFLRAKEVYLKVGYAGEETYHAAPLIEEVVVNHPYLTWESVRLEKLKVFDEASLTERLSVLETRRKERKQAIALISLSGKMSKEYARLIQRFNDEDPQRSLIIRGFNTLLYVSNEPAAFFLSPGDMREMFKLVSTIIETESCTQELQCSEKRWHQLIHLPVSMLCRLKEKDNPGLWFSKGRHEEFVENLLTGVPFLYAVSRSYVPYKSQIAPPF